MKKIIVEQYQSEEYVNVTLEDMESKKKESMGNIEFNTALGMIENLRVEQGIKKATHIFFNAHGKQVFSHELTI